MSVNAALETAAEIIVYTEEQMRNFSIHCDIKIDNLLSEICGTADFWLTSSSK